MMGFCLVGSVLLIVICCDDTLGMEIDLSLRIKWAPFKPNPPKQEISGWHPPDMARVYHICRDHIGNGQNLGFFQREQTCEILVGGKRQRGGSTAEYLSFPNGTISWVKMSKPNNPPPNLILAGFDSVDGEALYICRGVDKLSGSPRISPGNYKFTRTTNKCEIDYDGQGILVEQFEMLIMNFYGIATRVAAD